MDRTDAPAARARRRVGTVVALVLTAGAWVTGAVASGGDGHADGADLPAGEYFHATDSTEFRTVYETRSRWARKVTNAPSLDRDLLLRFDEVLYHIDTASKHVLIIRDAPEDLVPEGFVLDPVFLSRIDRGERTHPPATAIGRASHLPGHVAVPERLETPGTTYVVRRFDGEPGATVEGMLQEMLSDPAAEIVELADAPQVPLVPGERGEAELDDERAAIAGLAYVEDSRDLPQPSGRPAVPVPSSATSAKTSPPPHRR